MARILVIDDESLILSLMKDMLENHGYEVMVASNGKIGIELFRENGADLVITDIIMPKQEGLSTIFELKKDFPDLKIFALSGGGGRQGVTDYLEAAKKFGASRIYTKPVDWKALLEAIKVDLEPPAHISPTISTINPNAANILLVDEQPEDLLNLTHYLTPAGHAIIQAHSYQDALTLAGQFEFALVLLAIQGEETEGFQTARAILQITQNLPPFLVFISTQTQQEFVIEGYKAGAVDFLFKPIQEDTLKNKVQVLVELYQQKILTAKQTQTMENALQTQCIISDNLIQTAKELKNSKKQLEEVYSELKNVTEVFQLFVPKPFLNRITNENTFEIGKFEEENFSILFGDIRGYTQHAEQMTPRENFDFLNEYFSLMEPLITKHEGFIDKFMGDGIMALFDQKESADHALRAAVEMQEALQAHNQHRKEKGLAEIKMGIGINTGEVMVGALGSENRLNSTVIGDHVNLSARLEELTKKFGVQIIISEHTHSRLQNSHYLIREIDTVKVRGKSNPVVIYDVFNADPPKIKETKIKTRDALSKGIQLYKEQQFTEALQIFQQCLEICQDVVIFQYVKRCDYFQKHPPQDQPWDCAVSENELLIEHAQRRRAPRYPLKTHADIYSSTDLSHLDGTVTDISTNGISLETETHHEIGSILFVEVPLSTPKPSENTTESGFKLLAQVKRKNSVKENGHTRWQIGLETSVISSESGKSLQEVLDEYHQDAEKEKKLN